MQVTYEQLRPAYGMESWTPSLEDMKALKTAELALTDGLWRDERGPGPPEEETLDVHVDEPMAQPLIELPEPAPLLGAPEQQERAPQPPMLPVPPQAAQQPLEPMVYSPTFKQNIRQNIHQHFGTAEDTRNVRPRLEQPSSSLVPFPQAEQSMRQYQWQRHMQMTQQATAEASAAADLVPLPSEPHVPQPPGDAPPPQAEATPMALEGQPAAEDVPIPGSSSGPTTMSQSNIVDHFTFIVQELPHEGCEMVRVLPGWDGTTFMAVPAPSTVFRAAATSMGEPEDLPTDSSDDEDVGKSSSLEHLSRQERKALDREIPWRVIVAGPKEIFDLYVAANIKEYESWLSWACIRPLSEERIHEIKNTPSLKRRIIPARNAYRDKNRSAGPTIKAKCRNSRSRMS